MRHPADIRRVEQGMSEPTVELPQLSLARYFDLLKRRRWQVIPVSLLGLLIGGIVAFFVPRYYVAEVYVDYYRLPAEVQTRPTEDPFKFVVDNATILIPQSAGPTIKKLGWPESAVPDAFERRQGEREIEERIRVVDINPGQGRGYARLVVTYRDRDGVRAAAFLNTLVATWMAQQVADMRRGTELQSEQANQRARAALGEYTSINRELTHLSAQYGFERMWDEALQREDMRIREASMKRQEERLDAAHREVAVLEQQIANTQRKIDRTPRDFDSSAMAIETRFPAGSQEAQWFLELKARKRSLENSMGPAHPDLRTFRTRVAWLEKELSAAFSSEELTENPKLKEARTELEGMQVALAAAVASRDRLLDEVAAAREEQKRRADAAEIYFAKQRGLQEAQDKRDDARKQLEAALDLQQQLDSKAPVKQVAEAFVPKKPTEPNIALVAGLGCLLGLGAAIVLILLLDVLRGTLKTVDDVERALSVPMLGAVSHLETLEERAKTVSRRRRSSLVAGAILMSAVVLVTTYYVAPHRLPPFALNLLSIVLGG